VSSLPAEWPPASWPYDSVTVSGPDAGSYLQSQLSQDITGLAVGSSVWAFLLQPNGRVDVLTFVLRTADDTFELRVDAGWADALLARLNRFKIRVKADVAVATGAAGDTDAYLTERVEAGWPAMGAEITDRTIPAELPDVVAVAVNFKKGCYPGQELVERMDSREAQAPRRLVAVDVEPGASAGDPIVVDGVDVGVLTTVSGSRALGFVKRGVDR
jgi:folate-binding protein YgfZ